MDLFRFLLAIHISCGSISLLLGFYIILAKKGTSTHRRLGKIFFYSMLINSFTAIPMTYIHPNYFLFLISILTVYMLLTGVRYLTKMKVSGVNFYDWMLTTVMLMFSIAFIGFGIFNIVTGNYFGIVFMTFGSIGLLFTYQDFIHFKGNSKIKNYFMTTHIQRMTGSYIATLTAFLVVNNKILPNILAWLLPTIILVPIIIKWTRKYKVESKNYR